MARTLGSPSELPPASCLPPPWAQGREQSLGVGGGCLHQGSSGLGWSEPMGELRAQAKAQEAAGLGPRLDPHHLTMPLYNTPGFPRHNVTMSASDPCHPHRHHLPRLLPPPDHIAPLPLFVSSVTCSHSSSPTTPVKMKVRPGFPLLRPTRVGPQCHSE